MKKTSKILSMILALMMIMSVMIIPASADAIPYAYLTIVTDKTEVEIGDYVAVDVMLSEDANIGALTVDLNYDPTVFTVDMMYSHGLFGDYDYNEKYNSSYADGKARFTGATAGSVTEGGALFTVVLLAIDDATESELSISVEEAVDYDNCTMQIFTNTVSVSVLEEIIYPSLTIVADKTEVEIGDTVQVDVYVSENSNLGALTVDLVFDSDVFEPVMMVSHGMFNFDDDDDNEETNIAYADDAARFVGVTPYSLTEEGILFTVLFEVVDEAFGNEMWLYVEEACDSDYDIIYPETNSIYFDSPLSVTSAEIYINEPSRTTIRHKDGIVLSYTIDGDVRDDYHITWIYENDNFDIDVNEDGSITIISNNNGYTTFEILLVDSYGNVLSSDIVEMRSKAGFFDKIGSFFRSIFGMTTIYEY